MLKNKSFLNGFGIGLILGAVLLQLMFIAQAEPTSFPMEEESRQETLYNEQQLQERIQMALERQREEEITPLQDELKQAREQLEQLQTELDQSEQEVKKEPAEASQPVTLRVKAGMSAIKVADELYRLKLIDDPEAFVRLAVQSDVKDKLRTGNYVFETKPDMGTILKRLTTRPSAGTS